MLSPASFIVGLVTGFAIAVLVIFLLVWAVAHMEDADNQNHTFFDNQDNF